MRVSISMDVPICIGKLLCPEHLTYFIFVVLVYCLQYFSGTPEERAKRLFSLKGLRQEEYPDKVRGKNFIPHFFYTRQSTVSLFIVIEEYIFYQIIIFSIWIADTFWCFLLSFLQNLHVSNQHVCTGLYLAYQSGNKRVRVRVAVISLITKHNISPDDHLLPSHLLPIRGCPSWPPQSYHQCRCYQI